MASISSIGGDYEETSGAGLLGTRNRGGGNDLRWRRKRVRGFLGEHR